MNPVRPIYFKFKEDKRCVTYLKKVHWELKEV